MSEKRQYWVGHIAQCPISPPPDILEIAQKQI